MSHSAELFDLLSAPPAASPQQPPQGTLPSSLHTAAMLSSSGFQQNPGSFAAGATGQSQPSDSFGQLSAGLFSNQSMLNNQSAFGQSSGLSSNQQHQHQQQQMGSAFGQSSSHQNGIGQSSLFGLSEQTGSFGQPTQQNSAFGQSSMQGFGQASQKNVFGQSTPPNAFGQPNQSAFEQANQQNAFGQVNQPSAFGQVNQQSAFGQVNQPSAFGQVNQQSAFGQVNQPSAFGQVNQPSAFGQVNQPSTFGQVNQPSAFGQVNQPSAFGQVNQPSAFGQVNPPSDFGQVNPPSAFGQINPPSAFGQVNQQSAFGQVNQQNAFGLANQPSSTLGHTNQQMNLFGATSQGNNTLGGLDNLLSAGVSSMQTQNMSTSSSVSSAPASPFGSFTTGPTVPQQQTSSSSAGWLTGNAFGASTDMGILVNQKPAATPTPANTPANENFFAAFSSSPFKPATATNTAPTEAAVSSLNDSFLSAFSQSTTLSNARVTPSPTPGSPFDPFSSPPIPQSQNAAVVSPPSLSDSAFDPFGLNQGSPPQQATAVAHHQQQESSELQFEAFNQTPPSSFPDTADAVSPSRTISSGDTVDSLSSWEQLSGKSSGSGEGQTTGQKEEKKAAGAASTPIQVPAKQQQEEDNSISDPVLREIHHKFGGRWKLIRSDPYDEFLKSIGIGLVYRKRAGKGSPEQVFEVKNDQIHISLRSTFHSQAYVFRLNEQTENLVEKVPQSVFCSYSRGKLFLQMTPVDDSFGKTQEVERFINEHNEQVVIHSAGIASCRRYFARADSAVAKVISTAAPTTTEDTKPAEANLNQDPDPINTKNLAPTTLTTTCTTSASEVSQPQTITTVRDTHAVVLTIGDVEGQSKPPSRPVTPITPGQLLLQNLQGSSESEIKMPEASAVEGTGDNGQTLIFEQDFASAESEA